MKVVCVFTLFLLFVTIGCGDDNPNTNHDGDDDGSEFDCDSYCEFLVPCINDVNNNSLYTNDDCYEHCENLKADSEALSITVQCLADHEGDCFGFYDCLDQ